jgi:4-hydroxybutyrate dehydrogenase/sulfolactaldehyde 3-reductase
VEEGRNLQQPGSGSKGAEFVITMLPNGDLVRSVLFGEQASAKVIPTG